MDNFKELANLEKYFKNVNCYGNYNYCFTCQLESSVLLMFGVVGALIEMKKNKKVMGYLFNQTDTGICLIPIIADTLTKNKIDQENYQFIKQDDIAKVIIKNEDFVFKKIKIILKNQKKIVLKTSNKLKGAPYHENNLNKFIELYKNRG